MRLAAAKPAMADRSRPAETSYAIVKSVASARNLQYGPPPWSDVGGSVGRGLPGGNWPTFAAKPVTVTMHFRKASTRVASWVGRTSTLFNLLLQEHCYAVMVQGSKDECSP